MSVGNFIDKLIERALITMGSLTLNGKWWIEFRPEVISEIRLRYYDKPRIVECRIPVSVIHELPNEEAGRYYIDKCLHNFREEVRSEGTGVGVVQ